MNKIKSYYTTHKKLVLGIVVGVIAVVLIAAMLYMNREQVKQLVTDYDVNVNAEVDTDITKYLEGVKSPDQVEADWKSIDTKKVGTYDVLLKYKSTDYKITFHVRDMDSPIVKLSKKEFTFSLDSSVEDINNVINESISVVDNYDKEFKTINVVSELPKEVGEQTYNVSVKDQAGNESMKEQIKVIYTEPKEEPEDSQQQENEIAISDQETNQGDSAGQNTYTPPVTNTPTPEPTPEPQAPVEQPPVEEPTQTEGFNFPASALETYTTTDHEDARNWMKSIIKDKYGSSHTSSCQGNSDNSVWYCYVE